jgi:predicted lipoprotein with Yx(FWY)xxD motif
MSTKRWIAIAGTAVAAGLTLAACGNGGGNSDYGAAPQNTPSQNAAAAAGGADGLVLSTAQNAQLGAMVVNGKGFTVYRFDQDSAKPPAANCVGACAKLWSPVKFTDAPKLTGIQQSVIGNLVNKDGVRQATINGWPAYTYSGDTAPGQINGQGVLGTWYAIAPDGSKAGGGKVPAHNTPSSTPSSDSGGDGGGYGGGYGY